jgi:uncharacterized protein (DUF924 family)
LLIRWFIDTSPSQWFRKDPDFDALVRERFLGLTRQAIAGELGLWSETPQGGLALSQQALDWGWVEAETEQPRRQFWLMPLMHSEEQAVQEAALPLFRRFVDPRTADFALRHRDVIAQFGRFPHRNAALGRVSSAEELAFLQTPGSGF